MTESRGVVSWLNGGGLGVIGAWLLRGTFGGDEDILELDSSDGCTTLNILKTINLYT